MSKTSHSCIQYDKKSNSSKFVGLCYSICGFLVMVLDSTSLHKSYLSLKHELPFNVALYRSWCRDYLFSCKIVFFNSHSLHLSFETRYLRAFVWYSFFTIFNFISDFFFSTYIILNLHNYMIRAIVCNVFIRSTFCIIEKP